MGFSKVPQSRAFNAPLLLLLLVVSESRSATVKDIFNLNTADITRIPRDTQYHLNRYGSASSGQTVSSRPIKPEDAPEARERDGTNVEKRCIRCDYYNRDYKYPSDYRSRYDERYDDRYSGRDRYDDRGGGAGGGGGGGYRDRYYEDYDRKYYGGSSGSGGGSDRKYYDDRRYDDRYERYDPYDRYDRDRYDRRPAYYDTYDRDRYDRDDRYRYYDRYDRGGSSFRPWDETTRGSSGFDSNGRGYYFAVGRPEYSTYGSGYASNWNYGDKNGSRDRDRWREQGNSSRPQATQDNSFSSGSYRPRDPYDSGYYNRGTSYLYGRPSSTTTTQSPTLSGGSTVTDNPQPQGNTSSG